MSRVALALEFAAAADSPEHFPRLGLPEVAMVGRSNVGKSSFINALAGKSVARTSRTPGRTRSVNFYRAAFLVLVDLPGYGYARVSKEERNRWKIVIESFLSRSELRLVVLLLDARTGPTASDRTMIDWLKDRKTPAVAVLTKADKVARNAVRRIVADAAESLGLAPTEVLAVSARTGEGVKEAWTAIAARIG